MTILHPFAGWQNRLARWQAWRALNVEDETAVLHYFQTSGQKANEAQLLVWRLQGRWDRILAWLEMQPQPERWLQWRERAFGETSQTEKMVQLFQERLKEGNLPIESWVQLFAFAGYAHVVDALLKQKAITRYGEPALILWRVNALQASGQWEEAEQLLQTHKFPLEPFAQATRQQRLDHPLPKAELSPTTRAWCDQQAQIWLAEAHAHTPFMTYWLIGLTLLTFAWQWHTGALNNARALFLAGGLLPQAVWQNGDWWRLGSAIFLHADIWHVGLNMLGLYWLGQTVEGRLGWWRFLLVYFGAGLGASLLIVGLSWWEVLEPSVNVGASGSVLGLLGGLAVWLWRQYQQTGNGRSLTGLREIAIILVLQTAFDLSNPQVSFVAHAGGAIIGAVLTLLITAQIRSS